MTNRELGRAYIEDARIILAEAEDSIKQGHYHRVVRKCQESVEMALKGASASGGGRVSKGVSGRARLVGVKRGASRDSRASPRSSPHRK